MGSVDYRLAGLLIVGTVPGVYLGAHISVSVRKDRLKRIVNMIILIIGLVILIKKLVY
ncbi:hypothetical protein [Thermococcus sp.]